MADSGTQRRRSRLTILLGLAGIVIVLGAALIVILFVAAGSRPGLNPVEAVITRLSLALRSADLARPLGSDPQIVCFTVNPGDTAGSIAARLAAQGFALDADLFRSYVRFYGIDSGLQAGTFTLARTFTIPQIAARLSDPGSDSVSFLVQEGLRIEEIAARIDRTPNLTYSGAQFMALVGPGAGSQPGAIGEFAARAGIPAGRSLEGFLFPDTYTLAACGSVQDLVQRMLENFDNRVAPQMRSDVAATGLNLYQAVTLASIVQRETAVIQEAPAIAGVYLNRLRNSLLPTPDPNIPTTLDADPTVQYALGNTRDAATWWPPLTAADYRGVSSPYNTYMNPGLPPGPIDNPGLDALRAAIYPQPSPYLYFRACPGDGGRHRFSTTFAEHQAACS